MKALVLQEEYEITYHLKLYNYYYGEYQKISVEEDTLELGEIIEERELIEHSILFESENITKELKVGDLIEDKG
ncbi:hypothetical protein [Chengkuizengella marina]|uniref:Uncharacterized protein n=1 Tax=Chengkuizengella marina TaxID=2507566 RepID=A0A6N9Q126_9BACL|nr:hypothetical protein [Chengkuizengella marina]NBI28665.1 hypothetical protein [Chengkuizengella marina]